MRVLARFVISDGASAYMATARALFVRFGRARGQGRNAQGSIGSGSECEQVLVVIRSRELKTELAQTQPRMRADAITVRCRKSSALSFGASGVKMMRTLTEETS